MTRHNLDIHISWLLSHEVILPASVSAVSGRNSTATSLYTTASEVLEEDTEEAPGLSAIPTLNRPAARAANEEAFVRPPLPTPIPTEPRSHILDSYSTAESESMGKLSSAQRSTRPSLMSQHQLATPASTSATTSSLAESYARSLRENNTPSVKSLNTRPPKPFERFQTPQTPRQTPRPTIELDIGTVQSVDLTGDTDGPTSRSSSTDGFGEPVTVWREESAWRAEPLGRSSKKRKSDEISVAPPRKGQNGEYNTKTSNKALKIGTDDFMDIDEWDDGTISLSPGGKQRSSQESCLGTARPAAKNLDTEDSIEEYQIMETISRVETRTRKSLSRVPTGEDTSEVDISITRSTSSKAPRLLRTESKTEDVLKSHATVQVARSPLRSPEPLSPKKLQKHRPYRTIQDSEEEEESLSDTEKDASRFSKTVVKNSPQSQQTLQAKMHALPEFESTSDRLQKSIGPTPRVGSPLRPISENIASKQEHISSPLQQPTPKKPMSSHKSSFRSPCKQMFPSPLTALDKKVTQFYLTRPESITTYFNRIKSMIQHNAAVSYEYMDRGETAPQQLVDERKSLLDKQKAYQRLEMLRERRRDLAAEKKDIARKICDMLESGVDTGHEDERMVAVTQNIKSAEEEIGQLLHASGAISDGFGTGFDLETAPTASSKTDEYTGSFQSKSSTVPSNQVILQTQIPSLDQNAPFDPSQHNAEAVIPRSSSRSRPSKDNINLAHQSPSPVRLIDQFRPLIQSETCSASRAALTVPSRTLKQPNFLRDPSSIDYAFDDEEFENLVQKAEEAGEAKETGVWNRSTGPQISTAGELDEYGDGDDDEMLEFAQEVEKRQSLPDPTLRRTVHSTDRSERSSRTASSKRDMYSHMDSAHASMLNHPWSKDVKKALKDRFKLRGFRQNQLEAINATLSGKDAFILMPTGGGKSLCYQLPAIVQSGMTRGVTIVISPLLSLMSDQVDHLQRRNIQAFVLNGEKSAEERDHIFGALRESKPDLFIQLLYVTPEMIGKSSTLMSALSNLHKKKKLARIVIDEAHCVSQWGHDFRQDYKNIGSIRSKFPGVPFIALTATATENVKADCIHNLGMQGCEEHKQSFNRPNLYYEVRPKKGKGANRAVLDDMSELILKQYKGQTGIVYTLSRDGCEDLAKKLVEKGIKAHHFHAHMEPEIKQRVQRDWQAGKWQVVVATIAFGMGIDKPDVRFVIHHTIPKSLEGYYQETGRAGRDGEPSGCYLYYGFQDTAVLNRFIDKGEGTEEVKDSQRQMLKRMVQFCENEHDCRRAVVLSYFGEEFSKEECHGSDGVGGCDNCRSDATFEPKDVTSQAQAALRIVEQLQNDNITLAHAVDILRGRSNAKIKANGHNHMEEYGAASDLPPVEAERIFTRLLLENALREYSIVQRSGFANQYIKLGRNNRDFRSGRRRLNLMHRVSASPARLGKKASKAVKATRKTAISRYPPTSTIVTSPASPSSRRPQAKWKNQFISDDDDAENSDIDRYSEADFIDDDSEDAFEPQLAKRAPQDRRALPLGPAITTDARMEDLPEIHQDCVHNFVAEAKKTDERLRSRNGHRKPYFTDNDFREMAIMWTLTVEDMLQIPGIQEDKVRRYGKHFTELIGSCHHNYEEMSSKSRVVPDRNHENVIDLCDSDEGVEDEDNDVDNDDLSQEDQRSRFFVPEAVQAYNEKARQLSSRSQSRSEHPKTDAPKQTQSSFRGRSKPRGGGRKRSWGRKSNGSASGYGSGVSNAGLTKQPRKTNKKSSSAGLKGSSIMQSFGRSGGGGGGIGMMPA